MQTAPRHLVVATAGHIDHGKTALVRALTGMETDRLEEEKRRGITIELGFAFLGEDITIIDVPGHERFIKTMVAGVSTVDIALLVIAADDSVMPQTREHLDILQLLGVPRLWVVLTKVENQDPEWVKLCETELADLIPDNYKATLKLFRCDSLSGRGIEELRSALLAIPPELPLRHDSGVFRLAIDRAFSVKGFGRIVTGTILGGQVTVGDRLWILPEKQEVRVRGLQLHGQNQSELRVGQRAAINLSGANLERLQRGDWLVRPEAFLATSLLDVALQTVSGASPLKSRDRVRLHLGTAETLGRVVLLSQDFVNAGEKAYAQISLENSVVATRGDRFILRRYSPLQTLGGGIVLDSHPPKRRRSAAHALRELTTQDGAEPAQALTVKVKYSGRSGVILPVVRSFMNLASAQLGALIRAQENSGDLVLLGSLETGLLVAAQRVAEAKTLILNKLDSYHTQNPELLGLSPAQLQSEFSKDFPLPVIEFALGELLKTELMLEKSFLRKKLHQAQFDPAVETRAQRIEVVLEAEGFNPPPFEALRRKLELGESDFIHLLNQMILQGRVVKTDEGIYWTRTQIRRAWEVIKGALSSGEGKTTAQLRDALGCPRRVAVSLLEYLDHAGFTLRREDTRLPGPKFEETL